MAKQIKVFSGSFQSGIQTLYTVPAGRVAKVVFNTLYIKPDLYVPGSLTVGGMQVLNVPTGSASASFTMPAGAPISAVVASGYQLVTDSNLTLATMIDTSGIARPSFFNKEHYLNAGQTVQISVAGSGSSAWSFLVIEEY